VLDRQVFVIDAPAPIGSAGSVRSRVEATVRCSHPNNAAPSVEEPRDGEAAGAFSDFAGESYFGFLRLVIVLGPGAAKNIVRVCARANSARGREAAEV
jgi:hypothetical protein